MCTGRLEAGASILLAEEMLQDALHKYPARSYLAARAYCLRSSCSLAACIVAFAKQI